MLRTPIRSAVIRGYIDSSDFLAGVPNEGRMLYVSAVRKLNFTVQLSSNQAYANFSYRDAE